MFSERLKDLRNAHRLTQPQLAECLGVTKQSISNWENNNIMPSVEVLVTVAGFFHVSTDFMLGIDHRKYVEVSCLTLEEMAHIQQIINDITQGR